ncbi:hypothetical protein GM658_09290 [Pseudoduganella eburnea]|uniref:DUF883 family protein n=1 Tax=Massilia eburnea TaxID=1776165 RepID=A0A6L6QFZ1_9BURK|nr:hypothetical protein [Massilia eburnea]MTW10797.1 hypothetical protein [Massilia eburnea]
MDNNITRGDGPSKDLRAGVHSTVDKVADNISSIGDQMSAKSDQLNAAYKRFAESGRNYVRTSPGKSLLVALAAGYAVSKLLGARKH